MNQTEKLDQLLEVVRGLKKIDQKEKYELVAKINQRWAQAKEREVNDRRANMKKFTNLFFNGLK